MSETETPAVEVPTPSKMTRVRNVAVAAGVFVIPSAVTIGASIMGLKASVNNLNAAKLTLEGIKLTKQV
jgi:hypothetical protein